MLLDAQSRELVATANYEVVLAGCNHYTSHPNTGTAVTCSHVAAVLDNDAEVMAA